MNAPVTCRAVVELLMDYVDGLVEQADKDAIEAHFARCPRCVEFLRSYRETPRILREATAAEMPAVMKDTLRRILEDKHRND